MYNPHHLSFALARLVLHVLLGMVTELLDPICVPECLGTEPVVGIGGHDTVAGDERRPFEGVAEKMLGPIPDRWCLAISPALFGIPCQ